MESALNTYLNHCYQSADCKVTTTSKEYWLSEKKVLIVPNIDGTIGEYQLQFEPTHVERMVIWPDFMHSKPNVLLSRLAHFNGNSNSIYGRDTSIVMPANTMSNDFHSQHHLLGGLEGKRNIGLSYQSSLVGLASFSRPCPIDRDGQKFTSIELNRVSFKSHHHIPGGLTRMIKAAETSLVAMTL